MEQGTPKNNPDELKITFIFLYFILFLIKFSVEIPLVGGTSSGPSGSGRPLARLVARTAAAIPRAPPSSAIIPLRRQLKNRLSTHTHAIFLRFRDDRENRTHDRMARFRESQAR